MDIISTKLTNTLTTYPTSIVSINCHSKKVRNKNWLLYFPHSFINDHITIGNWDVNIDNTVSQN